jgi:hypothetical protein
MACPNCGSWAVRADRSLSGRMVCGRCGEPLGLGSQHRHGRPARGAARRYGQTKGRRRFWLGLAALLVVSAVLTALADRRLSPPNRWNFGGSSTRSLPLRHQPLPLINVVMC